MIFCIFFKENYLYKARLQINICRRSCM